MGMHAACLEDIRIHGIKALASVLTFLMIPEELFGPPLEAAEGVSELDNIVISDAYAYFRLLSCLNSKIGVVLAYTGVEKDGAFEDLGNALMGLIERVGAWKCGDDAIRDEIATETARVICQGWGITQMLIAPTITPTPVKSYASIDSLISFELVSADILLHLARTGSGSKYIQSGYADPTLFPMGMAPTLDNMLGCYKERIQQCMEMCC